MVELFLFTLCYAMAILINAAVDVVLEGPMQGIWFWCLFGFGIGSVMVYRATLALGRDDGMGPKLDETNKDTRCLETIRKAKQ